MLNLLQTQQHALFAVLIISFIISLTFHEFAHAASASLLGDNTAKRLGRLNINPVKHIDPMGLLILIIVGFGYAKPVPTTPSNFSSRWSVPLVALAGPAMNLLLAFIAWNIYQAGLNSGNPWFNQVGTRRFFEILTSTNIVLMLFNLIPISVLDGHYILGHLLPEKLSRIYFEYNRRYGHYLFLGIMLLSLAGLPIFSWLVTAVNKIKPLLQVV